MRALVMHRHGGPEVLTLEREWPRPVAGPGEIVVAVKACALNYLDIFTREGMPGEPTPLPHITGGDVAGVVAETGPGVDWPPVGARVLLNPNWGCGRCEYCREGETTRCLRGHMLGEMDPGGLAEYVRVPAMQAITIPSAYPFELAACLPVAWGTAWRMVVTHADVKPGDVVVVTAAAGGVGLGAVQIAKLQGARVVALASSASKLARLKTLGADETVNYVTDADWDAAVRRFTGKRGADVIIETVGASTWERSIRALGKGGRLVTSGATSGPIGPTDIRYLFRREHRILGSNGWTHNELLRLSAHAFAGRLTPVVDRVLPLERTAEGEVALARREVFGKVVITPDAA
ncbi:MAG: zinc-binding dehydrogenase [Candidatus Rokubacteria bacterium]|nr:zinc-binding dehydrogenase [Candidatus Rokubacteria bacterium]